MPNLTMKDEEGNEKIVTINETIYDYGGFGSVFEIPGEPDFVIKQIKLPDPQPIGDISRYIAHIRTTRERLLGIKSEEGRKPFPRMFIYDYIDEIVEQALSTHWSFNSIANYQFDVVWFLQKRAPGKKLLDCFREDPPSIRQRLEIARDVITRMRTLRRANLIHLDCVADNIFVDLENQTTTMIDLDGCGVIRQTFQQDEWEYPPLTLGHLNSVRPPTWYPQVGMDNIGPKAGNYLFAERWVVLDTVIRILTWNRVSGALSWLEQDTRKALVDGYKRIKYEIDMVKLSGKGFTITDLRAQQYSILRELQQLSPLPPFRREECYPPCLNFFADLLQSACFDQRKLGSNNGTPYEIYLQQITQDLR
jgi:hypothetical protein